MTAKRLDENDKLRAGVLPDDPESDTVLVSIPDEAGLDIRYAADLIADAFTRGRVVLQVVGHDGRKVVIVVPAALVSAAALRMCVAGKDAVKRASDEWLQTVRPGKR